MLLPCKMTKICMMFASLRADMYKPLQGPNRAKLLYAATYGCIQL
jgi:hypothetical protein